MDDDQIGIYFFPEHSTEQSYKTENPYQAQQNPAKYGIIGEKRVSNFFFREREKDIREPGIIYQPGASENADDTGYGK